MNGKQHKNKQKQPHFQEIYVPYTPPPKPAVLPNNTGISTFSNLSKQAESLVNGDISITFSNYNNNILFKSKHVETNECVNIDVIHKKLQKLNAISFENNSELKGISDGYTTNKQGSKIPLYDKNIALSTVFAYEYQHKIDSVRRDLNSEIEKRKNADDLLNKRVDEANAEISALKTKISALEAENKTQNARISQLEALTKHFVQ
jgi:hypothetical protein